MNTMAINLKGPLLHSCVGIILTDFSFKICYSQLLLKYMSIENLQTGNNRWVPMVLNNFLVKKQSSIFCNKQVLTKHFFSFPTNEYLSAHIMDSSRISDDGVVKTFK